MRESIEIWILSELCKQQSKLLAVQEAEIGILKLRCRDLSKLLLKTPQEQKK